MAMKLGTHCIQAWWTSIVSVKGKLMGWTLISRLKLLTRIWKNLMSHFGIFFFTASSHHGVPNEAPVIYTGVTAGMNSSEETSYPEEMLGNSTWAYSSYHQNYTVSPPLIPGKIKPAACEQLHIAVEVWAALNKTSSKPFWTAWSHYAVIFPFLRRSQEQLTVTTLYHPLMTHSNLLIRIYIYIFYSSAKTNREKPETASYQPISCRILDDILSFSSQLLPC